MSAEPGIWFALSSRMQPRKFNDGKRLASNVRHVRLLLIALWLSGLFTTLAIPMSRASAQGEADSADRAFDILSRRCFQCHGANGLAKKNIFVLDRERLLSSGVVAPGDPNSLLLKLVDRGEMPLGGPELPPEEKAVLRRWVSAGAPGWPDTEKQPNRQFLTEPRILQLIRSDLLNAPERSRPFLRYLSLAHLYNSGASKEELTADRAALSKLINSLSWQREITAPAAVDTAGTLFRIDLRDYGWSAELWNQILAFYPYGVMSPDSQGITRVTGVPIPYLRGDWFAANASVPPLYHHILGLPGTALEMERQLGIDAARDLQEEKNVARAGLRSSGVSQNNRVLERHVSPHGAYWKSLDFKTSLDDQNIFKNPLRLNSSGGEIIFNLPNGLQAYMLIDALGRRLDDAPIAIVSDRNNPDDPVIHNGRSCMSCHYAGIQAFQDDTRPVIRNISAATFDREKALALYPRQQELDQFIEKDRRRFQEALEQAGAHSTGRPQAEPVNALARRFLSDLTVAQAAAECGLETKEFRDRINQSSRLAALGLGQLALENGGIKRDAWEKNFGDVVREMQLGNYIVSGALPSIRLRLANGTGSIQTDIRSIALNRSGSIGAAPRTPILSADPNEILRSARTIFVMSRTVYLKPDQLEHELGNLPEFRDLKLMIVKDPRAADLKVELDRPVFTYTFTWTVTSEETSILVFTGKTIAFDGNFAAPKIAKDIIRRIKAAR